MVRLGYRPAYDGIRALAVLAVFLDHGRTRLHGGFVGVDVFFVLSGFLITTLLVEESAVAGRVDLRSFYGRRVRRLLPALVVALVLVGGLYAFMPKINHGWSFGPTAFAVLAYAGNWVTVLVDPVTQNTLGALTHTWSLAIEEQFYLLWPLSSWCA